MASMNTRPTPASVIAATFVAMCACALLTGCETTAGTITLGVVGGSAQNARSPGHEVEQVYYLGVFDPQDQVPPTIYRVRVHGQASALGRTQFASGWVPAQVIDSLGGKVGIATTGYQTTVAPTGMTQVKLPDVKVSTGEHDLANLETGRRLMQFGPEGFRETPRDHRLVIVMGASPQNFFSAVDKALGTVSKVQAEERDNELVQKLFDALRMLRSESERLGQLGRDVDALKARGSNARN